MLYMAHYILQFTNNTFLTFLQLFLGCAAIFYAIFCTYTKGMNVREFIGKEVKKKITTTKNKGIFAFLFKRAKMHH